MRTEAEVKEALEKAKRSAKAHSEAKRPVDAAMASLMVSNFSWVLGKIDSPMHRVKIRE
jgi:hypothetical protein